MTDGDDYWRRLLATTGARLAIDYWRPTGDRLATDRRPTGDRLATDGDATGNRLLATDQPLATDNCSRLVSDYLRWQITGVTDNRCRPAGENRMARNCWRWTKDRLTRLVTSRRQWTVLWMTGTAGSR